MGELYRDKYSINKDSKMLVYLISQVKRDFAPIVLICGKQRIGKSMFGLSAADVITWFLYDEEFNVNRFVFFDANKFLKTVVTVRKRVVIIDEASKDLSKSEWFTLLNQVLSKIIETQGDLGNIYIIILPHASRLATQHKIYIDLKIVMTRRGQGKIFYMKRMYGELSSDVKKITKPYFIGLETLPLPPKHLMDEYEKLASRSKRQLAQEEIASLSRKSRKWQCLICGHNNNPNDSRCAECDKER